VDGNNPTRYGVVLDNWHHLLLKEIVVESCTAYTLTKKPAPAFTQSQELAKVPG
jgi:hypothetical protein